MYIVRAAGTAGSTLMTAGETLMTPGKDTYNDKGHTSDGRRAHLGWQRNALVMEGGRTCDGRGNALVTAGEHTCDGREAHL